MMKKRINYLIFSIALLLCSNLLVAQSDPNVPLFEVKNDLGQTVFAVYPGGVHIFIDDTPAKAAGGGFTVGRLGTGKATADDFFTVNPGDVRVILPVTSNKAAGGGFTVGRLGTGKATGDEDFLKVTPDSTNIYTNDSISGFNVRDNSNGTGISYLRLSPLNYFIGHSSGLKVEQDPLNPGQGKYNTFFGYNAGKNTVSGYKNVFLGYNAGLNCVGGAWNIFIGNNAGASSVSALSNICIGDQAGANLINGTNNIFIGTEAGYAATENVFNNLFVGSSAGKSCVSGYYNTYLGISAGFNATGISNSFVGNSSGFSNTGSQNTFLGSESGIYTGSGSRNVCIGHRSVYRSTGTGNVFIGNSANNTNFSTVSYSNSIAIGDSVVVGASNEVRLGNNDITSFYCMGAYNTTTASAANLYISSAGRFYRSTSSQRYKKDIVPLEINTQNIYKLNPVSFTSKTDNTRHFWFNCRRSC
ncbi:MAG: tail fiber domain-containing protein [Chloroflexia bacterium]|nr:tail fiber domain-containing protein [Chloroflexia bacterium]